VQGGIEPVSDNDNQQLNESMQAEADRIRAATGLDMVCILYSYHNSENNEVLGMAKKGPTSAAIYAARWYVHDNDIDNDNDNDNEGDKP